MRNKIIYVLVSSDLTTDNRVARTCSELYSLGHKLILVGRIKKDSTTLFERTYQTRRISTLVDKGPLFYASLSLRLFFILLFRKVDGILANDLDTLLPAYLIARLKRIPLVYDSHELFTEVPELIERPRIRNIWLSIEKMILPKLKYMTTVNHSIALVFKEKYGILPTVVRNVPYAYTFQKCTRKELGLPEDKFIIIIQGSGLNIGRGVEEVILALRKLENLVLLIVGSGDVIQKAKDLTRENKLEKQVIFIPRIPYQEMMKYTEVSDLGLSLDKPLGMNYMYSLPNKIFDYLQANIPILCTDLKEVSRIVKTYECGTVLEQLNEETLVSELKNLSGNYPLIKKYKENAQSGAKIENWENEKSKLIEILQRAFN